MSKKMTMGVIIGNRGFFPDQLAKTGRQEMIQALAKAGIDCIVLGPEESQDRGARAHDKAWREQDREPGIVAQPLARQVVEVEGRGGFIARGALEFGG